MKIAPLVASVMLLVIAACDQFVEPDKAALLKEKEKSVYVMQKDIDINGKKLGKGDRVRIIVTSGKEWIKVHAYPAAADELKADRILILYLFSDNFERKTFTMDFFNQQLGSVAVAGGASEDNKKKNVRKK